jgi:hypothetical protein
VLTVQLALPTAQLGSVRAASAPRASGRTSHNPPVVGSSPTRPTLHSMNKDSKISVDENRLHGSISLVSLASPQYGC